MNGKKLMDLQFDEFGRLILAGRGAVSVLLLNAMIAATGGGLAGPAPPGVAGEQSLLSKGLPESQEMRPAPAPDEGRTLSLGDAQQLMRSARSVGEGKLNAMCPC